MRYLSIYKSAEGVPATQAKMEAMGALIEKLSKSGHLRRVYEATAHEP